MTFQKAPFVGAYISEGRTESGRNAGQITGSNYALSGLYRSGTMNCGTARLPETKRHLAIEFQKGTPRGRRGGGGL